MTTKTKGQRTPQKPAVWTAEMTEEEAARVFGADSVEETGEVDEGEAEAKVEGSPGTELHKWVPNLPPNLTVPDGIEIVWVLVKSEWTERPKRKEDYAILLWPLNEIEERQAAQRARGDALRMSSELAKATIRVVNNVAADRTGDKEHPGCVDVVWSKLGPKGRHIIRNYYNGAHALREAEISDFFLHCFVTRIAESG